MDRAFLEGGLKAERYLHLLSGVLEQHVDQMPLVVGRFDFLQDEAPPHMAGELRKLMEEVLPGKWIGHGGPIE